MEFIEEVLKNYKLYPLTIERITDKVYKVTDYHNHQYALKKTSLDKELFYNWYYVYTKARDQNLKYILPLYMTRDNNIFVSLKGHIYYLSPWISKVKNIDYKGIHKIIGNIHSETLGKKRVKIESFIQKLTTYENKIKQLKNTSIQTIEYFEGTHYMSPVQLQFCTHFHHIMEAINRIENECEGLKELSKNGTIDWNISLTHGNIKSEHILFDGHSNYLINWEKSSYNYPIYDLIPFYITEAKARIAKEGELLEGFDEYMKTIKLNEYELSLMKIYLLSPLHYFNVLFSDQPMLNLTKDVERHFRTIQFGLSFSEHITKLAK